MDALQLQRFTESLRISPVELIREEIELAVLNELSQSNFSSGLVFKGGTALRLCYGSPRFSQDLDFNARGKVIGQALRDVLLSVSSDSGEIVIKDLFNKRYTLFALLRVDSVHLKQPFSVKIEISKKKYKLKKGDVELQAAVSPVSPLTPLLYTYSLERMFYEKKLALGTRLEPRDYFDLWFIGKRLKREVTFPEIRVNPSKFKGELNQLLPNHLKGWSSEFLGKYGKGKRS